MNANHRRSRPETSSDVIDETRAVGDREDGIIPTNDRDTSSGRVDLRPLLMQLAISSALEGEQAFISVSASETASQNDR